MNKMFVGFGTSILIVGALIIILAEIFFDPNAICPCLTTSPGQTMSCSCPSITSNFPTIVVGIIITVVGAIVTGLGVIRH